MATPRNNVVKLRLTDLEKSDWQKAAGGSRLLSDFIRRTVNAECERQRLETRNPGLLPDEEGYVPEPVPLAPAISPEPLPAKQSRQTKQGSPPSNAGQCPRWMHHRPGTYCGSCKKVIGK